VLGQYCWRDADKFARSADWRGVLDAAILPQRVQSGLQTQRCIRPDVAVEQFTIVPDPFDHTVGPVLGQPDRRTEIIVADPEQPLHLRVVRAEHFVDVLLRYAQLVRIEEREIDPARDLEPSIVTLRD